MKLVRDQVNNKFIFTAEVTSFLWFLRRKFICEIDLFHFVVIFFSFIAIPEYCILSLNLIV